MDGAVGVRVLALSCATAACGPQVSVADGTGSEDATANGSDSSGGTGSGSRDGSSTDVASQADASSSNSDTGDADLPWCVGARTHPDHEYPVCLPDRNGTWSATSELDSPASGWGFTMVWTGSEAIVWGGLDDGAAYDPAADVWTPIATAGAPAPRVLHTAIWTGSEMIVWGGSALPSAGGDTYGDGHRYRRDLDMWIPLTMVGAPTPRNGHSAVWTGDEMIVFGGSNGSDGARYDPAADAWLPIAPPGFDVGANTALWTGTEVIFWGGTSAQDEMLPGALYDPATDSWRPMTTPGGTFFVQQATTVWTGTLALYYGGSRGTDGTSFNRLVAYDPAADELQVEGEVCREQETISVAAWTGCDMLVWVAWSVDSQNEAPPGVYRFDGAANWYSEALDSPERRTDARALWTGDAMLVWGGLAGADVARSGALYRP
jgi:hypothetical protein